MMLRLLTMVHRYICLVFKPSDLRLLDHLSAEDIKQTLFIPFSFEEYFSIKQMGLAVDPAWGYYFLDEINNQYWENIDLAQRWFQGAAGELKQNGLSVAAADTMFPYYFFVECNFFNMVLSRILTQYKDAEFIAREQFGTFQQGHQENEDTPLGIFHYLCDRLAVKVRRIEIQRRAAQTRRPNVAVFPDAPENVLDDRKGLPRLLLVSSGGNYFREYLTATRNLFDVAACYCETLSAQTFQALKAMTSGPTLYIGRRHGSDGIDISGFWSAYETFETAADPIIDANPHIFRNRYFREFFSWIFTVRWPAVAELAAAAEEERAIAEKIDFAIVPALPIAEMAVLGHVLRSWRVPILWQGHGINVFPEHLSVVLGKEPAAGNEWVLTSMAHQLDGSAYEKSRIQIGSLSHNNLFHALRNHIPAKRLLVHDAQDDPIRVLIVTNGLSYGNIPLVDMGPYLDMLRLVLDIPAHLIDKVEIIFKPKPAWEPIALFEHVRKYAEKQESVHVLQNVPIAAAIDLVDICVGVGPETSAYIDAIIAGKPLVRLCEEGRRYFDRGDNCQLPQHIYVNAGAGRDLWAKIEKLMSDRDYYAQVIDMQNEVLVAAGLVQDVSKQLKKAAEIACRIPVLEQPKLPSAKAAAKSGAGSVISVKNGHIDSADLHDKFVLISGWAGDMTSGGAALAVLVVADGKLLTMSPLTRVRPDVPRRVRSDALLGFMLLAPAGEVLAAETVTVLALFSDGQLYPLHATEHLRKESCVKASYKRVLPDKPLFERNMPRFSGVVEGVVDDLTILDGILVFSGWVRVDANFSDPTIGLEINNRIATMAVPKRIDKVSVKGQKSRASFSVVYSIVGNAHDADDFSILVWNEDGVGGVLPFAFNVRRQLLRALQFTDKLVLEKRLEETERAGEDKFRIRQSEVSQIFASSYWSIIPRALRLRLQMASLRRSGLFDRKWYLSTYTDVAAVGIDPLRHYVEYGFREGRAPSAKFVES